MEYERHKISVQKRMSDDKIFKTMSTGSLPFFNDKATYGEDHKARDNQLKYKSPFVESAHVIVKHDQSFKPAAGRSHGGPLAKYPEFMNESIPR